MEKNENFLTELKRELNIKLNEYEMVSKTISEMIRKGVNDERIEKLRESNDALYNRIKEIRNYIDSNEKEEDESVEYEYYMDDDRNTNLFDSIKKIYDGSRKCSQINKNPYKYENTSSTSKYLDEINDTIDSRVITNRFVVDLSSLGISETMVCGVDYWGDGKSLDITIYDHVIDFFGNKIPVVKVLDGRDAPFSFTISKVDASGRVIYKEDYKSAKISQVAKYSLDHSKNDFAKIRVVIKYDEMKYETT